MDDRAMMFPSSEEALFKKDKRIAELEALREKQSKHISKLGKRIAELEGQLEEALANAEEGAYQADQERMRIETAEAELAKLRKELALWHQKSNDNQRLVDEVNHAHEVHNRMQNIEAGLREELAKLRESKDLCPVCLTWSWAPCDEGDEGAQLRGEEWVLCQCCNDSRIAMVWKGRAEELREALLIYGCHTSECQRECDCGFEAALAKGDEKC